MKRGRTLITGFLMILLAGSLAVQGRGLAAPQTVIVSPHGPYTSLSQALNAARAGDTIAVHGGVYAGPLVITKQITLLGYDWPRIEGNGRGTVVKLAAPGIVVKGFVIRNSGKSLDQENAGIAVEAPAAVIENNRLEETLFGIYLRKAHHSRIRHNVIQSKALPLPRRGDAIRVWYSHGVVIEGNAVEKGRDVVLWYSNNLTVRNNVVSEGRYGLHFMYCDDALIAGNRLLANSVGAFLMYSRRLHLRHNIISANRGSSGYGVGLKDMDDAVIAENLFLNNRVGAFVDNSPREMESTTRFQGNVFAFNDIGITMLPSVRRNHLTHNSFINNTEQVKIAGGGRLQDNRWYRNYWSDYVGYDGDGDGVGDIPYRAERLFENLMDRYPMLRLFLYSPATQAIDFAARAFPLVTPQPKLVDAQPLMAPQFPSGLPPLPPPSGNQGTFTAGGLLLFAGLLVLFPFVPIRSRTLSSLQTAHGGKAMVQVQNLCKRFGAHIAVDHLSFAIRPGEAVALWGPNGAGKTTVLRCLLGLVPFTGQVQIGEYEIRRQGKAARRLIGFVPQELHFYDELTVRETMRFYARLKKTALAPIGELLQQLGLAEYAQKPVRELSGGMKQRLALAVALLADPPVLILDEPTTNLDTAARHEVLQLLSALQSAGKTLLFSSHRLDEVLALADRVLVLQEGRLRGEYSPAELPRHVGKRMLLRLWVPEERIDAALTLLTAQGFSAARNGTSLWVQVAPQEKGVPLGLLIQAGIPVTDFDIAAAQKEGE